MNEKQAALRGKEAALVLDNEAFKAAMDGLKAAVLQQIDDCPIRDHEGRLLLIQLRKLAFKFEGILVGMVENGKLAQNRIDLDSIRDESAGRKMLRRVAG
jgi:hypothetical protein